MKTAIVNGVTGQDGSYLAELLLDRGYRVVGLTRRSPNAAARALPLRLAERVALMTWAMRDTDAIEQILEDFRPAEFYNCAALSSGAGMYDDAVTIGEINGVAVARILEAIRAVDAGVRFCQASSSEVFGDTLECPQTEATPIAPRSPYGAAKCYADFMIDIYRKRYGLFACSAILFNHESPRRGEGFVTRRIAREAARIRHGHATELQIGNLSAQRDWGHARDYVRAMFLMMQSAQPEDFVISTGKLHSVADFCECAFGHLDLDYREHVREDAQYYRSAEPTPLLGDSTKARRALDWRPMIGFRELVIEMVDAEMRALAAAA